MPLVAQKGHAGECLSARTSRISEWQSPSLMLVHSGLEGLGLMAQLAGLNTSLQCSPGEEGF